VVGLFEGRDIDLARSGFGAGLWSEGDMMLMRRGGM
jgi:hypothetical protein